jgi:hypothetical protein
MSGSIDEAARLVPLGCPWVIEYLNSSVTGATVYSSESMERKWVAFSTSPGDALTQAAIKASDALEAHE